MPRDINMKINIDGIGPHFGYKKIVFSENMATINSGIYASNGVGKTFISRMLRLVSKNYTPSAGISKKLLSIDKQTGKFEFSITDSSNRKRELTINLDIQTEPVIENKTGYIFHTFNSDFVDENLASRSYSPEGNIDGYILGKENIDVSEEKEKLVRVVEEKETLYKQIKDKVELAQKDLDKLKISKNITEYKNITVEKYLLKDIAHEEKSLDILKKEKMNLDNMPEDLQIFNEIQHQINTDILLRIDEMLKEQFVKSGFDENFVNLIKNKQVFVETGLDIYSKSGKNECPFCGQLIERIALTTIEGYKKFLNDRESRTLKMIDEHCAKLSLLRISINEHLRKMNKEVGRYNIDRLYFPSIIEATQLCYDDALLDSSLMNLEKMLEDKKNDISRITFDCKKQIEDVFSICKIIEKDYKEFNKKVAQINKLIQNASSEKLAINRKICIALSEKNYNSIKLTIDKHLESAELEKKIRDEIIKKESVARRSKRAEVVDTFQMLLRRYFCDKYCFDSESFSLTFMEKKLNSSAKDILSDGEKSIVAFCFYLATTHIVVNNDDEYNNLFFIIDDPISSLDYHYVYETIQIIRNIKALFDITTHARFIVFTHNLDFFHMLKRNGIIGKALRMKPGKISSCDEKLMLPYDYHIKDVINVAKEENPPSHTTPNSIRHIIETICQFEYPIMSLEAFVLKQTELKDNEGIYSMMHDMSHGGFRNQSACTDDQIILGCKAMQQYLINNHMGQLEALRLL